MFSGTYQEAELKATKAQLTSDLSSNDDDKCIKKYKTTKTIVTGKKDEVISQQKLPNPPEFEEYESTGTYKINLLIIILKLYCIGIDAA